MAVDSLSDIGLTILEKYHRETSFALTRHHIDSYEQCIFEEIPSIIQSRNPLIFLKDPLDDEGRDFATKVEVYFGGLAENSKDLGLTISPPVVTVDGGQTVRRMFPNEARLRNLTYAAQINTDIYIKATLKRPVEGSAAVGGGTAYETEEIEMPIIKNFPLIQLPILLRSALCPTSVNDPVLRQEMGECRNDYGGYFIIDGAEKLLITREEQAFNSLYVEKRPDSDPSYRAYASVVSLHPETKQTRRVALNYLRGGEIRVAIPMIRGSFPLFILFRALGIESDEEIIRLIFPTPDPLESELTAAIADAYPIHNKYTAIQYIKLLTKGFTEAHVLDILQNLMLPHVPNEPMARAQYLAEMTRELIRASAGKRGNTDRDDMRNQRFLPTGVLVRELFNACWKDWLKEVILTIDRTYRRNVQLYQGPAVLDLFKDGNLVNMLQPALLNKSIMRGFHGRWGTNEFNIKKGVLQPLARISYLDAMSHTRRVVSDFDTSMKSTGPRKLHTSQIGYFCTSETPTGAHIGATKNMSMMTQYSIGASMTPVYEWLKLKGGLIPVAETTSPLRATAATVQINGGTVGFTQDPLGMTRILKLLKWNAYLAPTASVSFNTMDKTVRIYLDEGRPIRPLWHLDGAGASFLNRAEELQAASWHRLVFGTAAPPAVNLRTVQFVDPLADNPAATFAEYEALLAPTAGLIEYCDPTEMNETYISWYGGAAELSPEHTHCEIHPSTLTGLMGSMVPYSNHNQAPRNQLSCSQSKQGIGYMATNIKDRFDTYGHMLCYGEAPLCRTFTYDAVGNGEMPYGFNCIIAATSESGYNQDDGLIINRDSVARGMFQSLAFRSYDCAEEVDPRSKVHSHVANPSSVPAWSSLRPGLDYSKLDERGIIREGTYVDQNTVLVGRYMVLSDTNEIKDASVTPGLYTQGRVDTVVVLHQGDGRLLVKVRIIELRVPVLGDKFSSRHGQKGTIGMLVASEDLPRTAEGLVPDVMVNPGGLISRMTVAQLVEMVGGRAAVEIVAQMNATTFCNGGDFVKQLGDILQQLGASRAGDNVMYSGITGQQIRTDIFMCPLYFMRLKHLTEDKVNSRGMGRREMRTHQPTGGRANEGGLRIGEMERDSLCAHGVSTFLQESMMRRGDATNFWICNGCGRIPIYNEQEGLFVCPTCDGPLSYTGVTADSLTILLPTKQSRTTFSRVEMPYSLKLLDQEMTSLMNAGFHFVTEGSLARFREDDWDWKLADVEFEAENREIAAEAVNPEALAAAEEATLQSRLEKRKKKVVGDIPTTEKGAEGAEEVLEAAVGSAAVGGAQGTPVSFYSRLNNEYIGFSNFAHSPFRIDGKQIPAPDGTEYKEFGLDVEGNPNVALQTWPTVEHYYQAMKFPQDPAWQMAIRTAPTPARAKKMGLDREHPVRGDWERIKERVMKSALVEKFRQNPGLLSLLQGTADRPLVDASPGDVYWGVGQRGKGQNRMGALLQEVRSELRDVRVDETLLAAAEPVTVDRDVVEDAEAMNINATPSDLVTAAQETINAMVQVVKADGVEEGPADQSHPVQQTGGVYLFINPSAAVEPKAVAARTQRRHRGNVAWEGMSGGGVTPENPDAAGFSQEGEGDGPAVVTVEKLG